MYYYHNNQSSYSSMPTHTTNMETTPQNQLANLVGHHVKINRGGPDSVVGVIVAVQSDFIVVRTNDGTVFIATSHIKSISEMDSSGGNRSNRSGRTANYATATNFKALFQKLRHQFVQINRGGPEKVEGFVADSTDDFVLLLVDKELVRVMFFHIKTVSVLGKKGKNNNNNNNNNKNNNKSNGKSSNKSSSKSSNKSGNKSGSKSGNKSGNNSGNRSGRR